MAKRKRAEKMREMAERQQATAEAEKNAKEEQAPRAGATSKLVSAFVPTKEARLVY